MNLSDFVVKEVRTWTNAVLSTWKRYRLWVLYKLMSHWYSSNTRKYVKHCHGFDDTFSNLRLRSGTIRQFTAKINIKSFLVTPALSGKVEWIGSLKIAFIIESPLTWKNFAEKEVFEITFNESSAKGPTKSSTPVSKD